MLGMEKSKLLPLVGILIFAAVLLNTDLPAMAVILLEADAGLLVLVLAIDVPVLLIKAGKWKLITHAYGARPPLARCLQAWLVGFVLGIVTPGRIGEMTKVYYLKKHMPTGGGISTVVTDRIIDMMILFTLALTGGLAFLASYSGAVDTGFFPLLVAFFGVFVAGVSLVLTRGEFVRRLSRPLFNRFVPGKYKNRLRSVFQDFYEGMGKIRKGGSLVAASVLLSALSWLIAIFQFWLIAQALSIPVGYFFLLSVMPVVVLLDTLPISFSGVGTRDVALVVFLGILGIAAEAAVSLSIMIFLLSYMVYIPAGLAIWYKRPIRLQE